jgi:CRP-like cAMP-binding protein
MGERSFGKGETLFHEGDPGECLHLIEQGRVAVHVSTTEGDTAIVAVLGPGASFGEQALLGPDGSRMASAIALETVQTRTLNRAEFDRLRRAHPSVERLLVEALAAQVRRLTNQLLDALFLPVENRVLGRLAELAAVYATDRPPVDIPLRQEDLASLAGTTRSTANRVLRQLVNDGIVVLRRGRLVVIDPAALTARAG